MPGSILDGIASAYSSATASWLQTLLPIAERLFLALATIELAWSGIWWAIEHRRNAGSVVESILRKVVTLMFFYSLILFAPSWMPVLIASFSRAGRLASGFDALDPVTVLLQGIEIALRMLADIQGIWAILTTPPWVWFGPLVVVVSFAIIAGLMLVALVESYVVLGGGVLFLGFGGSRWTVSFTEGYFLAAVQVGAKLFVMYLLVGIGMSLPQTWLYRLTAAPGSPAVHLEILGGALILLLLIWRVPQLAARMVGDRATFRIDRAYSE